MEQETWGLEKKHTVNLVKEKFTFTYKKKKHNKFLSLKIFYLRSKNIRLLDSWSYSQCLKQSFFCWSYLEIEKNKHFSFSNFFNTKSLRTIINSTYNTKKGNQKKRKKKSLLICMSVFVICLNNPQVNNIQNRASTNQSAQKSQNRGKAKQRKQ